MFTLFSFLGRKFDELSETSLRRLNYALRILVMLIAALLLAVFWVLFPKAGWDVVAGFFTFIFILFCIDMGVSLKKVREKESSELSESCKFLLGLCFVLSFGLFVFIRLALETFKH
ncbi:hypothetical protein [uncultured Desulfovibrio sp.]|uniref:hypothetical protein n=1 Tax=uncultured Desulfovibrio sp. TaxID=167968 RepID=UPI0026213F3F|nr:hypothetical protein [uncultured Desulfovibrio sp.]